MTSVGSNAAGARWGSSLNWCWMSTLRARRVPTTNPARDRTPRLNRRSIRWSDSRLHGQASHGRHPLCGARSSGSGSCEPPARPHADVGRTQCFIVVRASASRIRASEATPRSSRQVPELSRAPSSAEVAPPTGRRPAPRGTCHRTAATLGKGSGLHFA